ncbi:hypothetical protein MKX01_032085 [Papaver californicum]|nr:hypothetical protein MKX01_032085 [Papaver californicum]
MAQCQAQEFIDSYPLRSYSPALAVEGYPPDGAFVAPPLAGYPGAELQVNNNLKLPEQPER